MKVLIVEDEMVAAWRLKKLVQEIDPRIEVMATLDSVLETTNFLYEHRPELIFLDVQLSDGMCFEIFEKLELDTPIIFTTAYDEYMQEAFKVNSVDYLLKPIRIGDLEASINKFKKNNQSKIHPHLLNQLFSDFVRAKSAYKCRFMVKSGRGFISVDVAQIAYIVSQNKLNYLITKSGKKYAVDFTLDQLERQLDPEKFKRINRNYILSDSCIVKVEPFFNNRMLVYVEPTSNEDILVSRSYLKSFKEWMDR